jgi:hypothetical protein
MHHSLEMKLKTINGLVSGTHWVKKRKPFWDLLLKNPCSEIAARKPCSEIWCSKTLVLRFSLGVVTTVKTSKSWRVLSVYLNWFKFQKELWLLWSLYDCWVQERQTNKPSYIGALVLFFFQAILDTVGLSPTRKTVLNILHNVSGILEPARCVQVHVLLLAIITSSYQCPFSLCAALFHFPLKIYMCVKLVEFFPSFFLLCCKM